MGQYYRIVNLDRREYVRPHALSDGAKLMELANGRTAAALCILLADGNGRGGGDCRSGSNVVGSWAGNRIVVAGDYADAGKHLDDGDDRTLYEATDDFADISELVDDALREDAAVWMRA